jgi:hypothetical protein
MDNIASKLMKLSDEQATSNETTNVTSTTKCAEATNVTSTTTFAEEEINGSEIEKTDGDEVNNEEVITTSKKGISISRSLILFGYESWTALEPCKFTSPYFLKITYICMYVTL